MYERCYYLYLNTAYTYPQRVITTTWTPAAAAAGGGGGGGDGGGSEVNANARRRRTGANGDSPTWEYRPWPGVATRGRSSGQNATSLRAHAVLVHDGRVPGCVFRVQHAAPSPAETRFRDLRGSREYGRTAWGVGAPAPERLVLRRGPFAFSADDLFTRAVGMT